MQDLKRQLASARSAQFRLVSKIWGNEIARRIELEENGLSEFISLNRNTIDIFNKLERFFGLDFTQKCFSSNNYSATFQQNREAIEIFEKHKITFGSSSGGTRAIQNILTQLSEPDSLLPLQKLKSLPHKVQEMSLRVVLLDGHYKTTGITYESMLKELNLKDIKPSEMSAEQYSQYLKVSTLQRKRETEVRRENIHQAAQTVYDLIKPNPTIEVDGFVTRVTDRQFAALDEYHRTRYPEAHSIMETRTQLEAIYQLR